MQRMRSVHCIPHLDARVAELVDARDSGSRVRKDVEVRVLSRALVSLSNRTLPVREGIFCLAEEADSLSCLLSSHVDSMWTTRPDGSRVPTAVGTGRVESSLGHQRKMPLSAFKRRFRRVFFLPFQKEVETDRHNMRYLVRSTGTSWGRDGDTSIPLRTSRPSLAPSRRG